MSTTGILLGLGADCAGLRLFDHDGPDLLPYATMTSARGGPDGDLSPVLGVYEWQESPLVLLVDGEILGGDRERLRRIRRLAALRGDAPYLGVVSAGRLDVYDVALDAGSLEDAAVDTGLFRNSPASALARLGNARPSAPPRDRRKGTWTEGGKPALIAQVVLELLDGTIGTLASIPGVSEQDAISLAGRALFARFLGDRDLLPGVFGSRAREGTLLDGPNPAREAFAWLDVTFNGDFLPFADGTLERLTLGGYKVLGDVSRRAPGGQLSLGWSSSWDDLHFAHIPVGVLSQAYERHLAKYDKAGQEDRGGYYTPRGIAEMMVRGAFAPLAAEGRASGARLLDPAAGAGVFLIAGFRRLVMERWRADGRRPDTRMLREILYGQVTGLDVDEKALRFAALGLYLISIELDPNPTPVEKLAFEASLKGRVLHLVAPEEEPSGSLGSLDPALPGIRPGTYDLVIGNPPWSRGTKLAGWQKVVALVDGIARDRLADGAIAGLLPNKDLDLAFVWRAMEWARPDGQIAFALHARLLFQQGDGMPRAREAVFQAIDVRAVLNASELRQTKVWPEVSQPFCLLFARNRLPGPGSAFRFLSPRLEQTLNRGGEMRIDPDRSDLVTPGQLTRRPDILKVLFRGGSESLKLIERVSEGLMPLKEYWEGSLARISPGAASGNGYQRFRRSSRTRKGAEEAGASAAYLQHLPEIAPHSLDGIVIDVAGLPLFSRARIHDPRPISIFTAPLLIVHEVPPAALGRIRVGVSSHDVVYNQSYNGYAAGGRPDAMRLLRFVALVIGSRPALWLVLLTSGRFGVERDVVEKATTDQVMIPDFDALPEAEREEADRLFDRLAERNDQAGWLEVDAWVSRLYGLSPADLQAIEETLRFNLPFAANRALAQAPPTPVDVKAFKDEVESELRPWGLRWGSSIKVTAAGYDSGSPWRGLRITAGGGEVEPRRAALPGIAGAADHAAATEVIHFDKAAGCLWVERLNQGRYWSREQARSLARHVVWRHVGFLSGRHPG